METNSFADSVANGRSLLKEVNRDFEEIQNISFIKFFNDERKNGVKITSLQDFCDGSKLGQRINQCNPKFKTPYPTPTTTFQKLTNIRAIFRLIANCFPLSSDNLFSPYSFINGTSVLIGTCYKLILCWNRTQFSRYSSFSFLDIEEKYMNDKDESIGHNSQFCDCPTRHCPKCHIEVKNCFFVEHKELVCYLTNIHKCPFCLEVKFTDRKELSSHMRICNNNMLGAFKENGGNEYAKFIEFNKQVNDWLGKYPFKLWYHYWKIAHESKFDQTESLCLEYLSKELKFLQNTKDIMKSKNYISNISGFMKDISIHIINSSVDIQSLMNLSFVCRDYYLISIRSNLWKKFYLKERRIDREKRTHHILINYKEEIEFKWRFIFSQYLNRVNVWMALYNFDKENDNDITLRAGGLYRILTQDEGWWEGESTCGLRGELPCNYVTSEIDKVIYQEYKSKEFYEGCYYIAKYRFIPQNKDELKMEKGDIFLIITRTNNPNRDESVNWLYSENCFGVKGFIPSNYLTYLGNYQSM